MMWEEVLTPDIRAGLAKGTRSPSHRCRVGAMVLRMQRLRAQQASGNWHETLPCLCGRILNSGKSYAVEFLESQLASATAG